uniref:Leucine-rich repeat domain-containing protein n=1 Tax=Chryseobacterium endophyticum TaxID=1854762 RepID=A0AAU6WL22_9FLAO
MQVSIKEFSKAFAHENQYYLVDGKFISLQLTNLHFENFDTLQPVFKMVKKLEFDNCTFNIDNIVKGLKSFPALESINLEANSVATIETFLQLETINELHLIINFETIPTNALILDFKGLKRIKSLRLYCENVDSDKMIIFKGAEYLNTLEKLVLECDCIIDELSKFKNLKYLYTESPQLQITHRLDSLTTLEMKIYKEDYNIYSLEQFPNLENLNINGGYKINLGELKKLKILCIGGMNFGLENISTFDNLPNLEKLELFNSSEISEIKSLDKLSNLKVLNLSENYEIENIDGIENLKNLEYINLYKNNISNVSVLNKLPKLKEVNVAGNNINQEDVEKQLEKPEVACFLSLPQIPEIASNIWNKIN